MAPDRNNRRRRPSRAFTLTELLIVLAIVLLISAATLPVVLPAVQHRSASEAARLVQATLVSARDTAVRANAPKGIRLLPDPIFNGITDTRLASNRIILIEPGPDYSEGSVTVTLPHAGGSDASGTVYPVNPHMRIDEQKFLPGPTAGSTVPNAPVSWYWNIRQGDKIRLGDSGRLYSVVGPVVIVGPDNPERFINNGAPGAATMGFTAPAQFLYVANNFDDDGDGFVDEMFDGINNNGDFDGSNRPITDPGFDGIDNNGNGTVDEFAELLYSADSSAPETEPETFYGPQFVATDGNGSDDDFDGAIDEPGETGVFDQGYTIKRRPGVSEGAREIALPADVVIDLTTVNTTSAQRSRLPVDPLNGYVDLLMYPNGEVVPSSPYGTTGLFPGRSDNLPPYYHFWIAERQDVAEPTTGTIGGETVFLLPMPEGAPGYAGDTPLKGERRLVTLSPRTGQIVTNTPDNFALNTTTLALFRTSIFLPYIRAQLGQRDSDR